MRSILVAAIPLLLAGCPQAGIEDPDGGVPGTTGASGSTGALSMQGSGHTTGSRATTGSPGTTGSEGTTGSSGTTSSPGTSGAGPASCSGSGAAPSFSCSLADGGNFIVAGQTVEVDCTASASLTWGVTVNLGGATVQNDLSGSGGKAYVTFASTALPVSFSDTQVQIVLSACSSGQNGTQTLSFNLLGNLLITDQGTNGIDAYTSDGTMRGQFLGPDLINQPTLVARLSDGSILVGGTADSSHPGLLHTDAQGNPLAAWDTVNHSNQPLWTANVIPVAAAQDPTGVVWVAAPGQAGATGVIHRFSATGSYQDDAPAPTNEMSSLDTFAPSAVAVMSTGDVVVTDASVMIPAVVRYPAGGGAPTQVLLGFELCDNPEDGSPPSCSSSEPYSWGGSSALLAVGQTLLVAINNEGEAMIGQFDSQFRFLLATAEPGSGDSERGYENTIFYSLAASGGIYMASAGFEGCIQTISPATLYDPNPNANDVTCWAPFNCESGALSMVHLGP